MLHKSVARSSCCPKEFYKQCDEGRWHLGVGAGKWRQRNLTKVKAGMKSRLPVSLSRSWVMSGSGFSTLTPSSVFCSWEHFSISLLFHLATSFGEPQPAWSDLRGEVRCQQRWLSWALRSEPMARSCWSHGLWGDRGESHSRWLWDGSPLGNFPLNCCQLKGDLWPQAVVDFFLNIYYLNSRCSCYPDLFVLGLPNLS